MAEAAKKPTKDSREETPAKETAKQKDWIGIALLAVVALNVLALGGMGYFTQKLWSRVHELQIAARKPAVTSTEEPTSTVGKELQPQNLGVLYALEGFLVNVNSEHGAKFLQAQMELELSDPSLEDEVSRKKAAIRDAIIVLLTSRSYQQLRAPNGLKTLRSDIMQSINHLLATGKVKEVYFTQFHFN